MGRIAKRATTLGRDHDRWQELPSLMTISAAENHAVTRVSFDSRLNIIQSQPVTGTGSIARLWKFRPRLVRDCV